MNLTLWIIAAVLAAVFTAAGMMKFVLPKAKLVASGFGWAQNFSQPAIKLIGAAEVLGAIGVILPAALHIVSVLVPIAAMSLAKIMVSAAVVHARRGEAPMIAVNVLLLALAATLAWGRFGPYGFTG